MSDVRPYSDILYREFDYTFDGEHFARAVKTWCQQVGVTQVELMEALGLSHSYVSTYLRTDIEAMPSVRNFLKVCNYCDLDPRAFFVIVQRD